MELADPPVNLLIRRREAALAVHHEHERRRLAHSQRSLRLDHTRQNLHAAHGVHRGRVLRRAGQGLQPAGVHHHELDVPPEGAHVHAVARDPGLVVHDGPLRAGQAVEQSALAHVGAADDRDARELLVRKRAPLPARLSATLRLGEQIVILRRLRVIRRRRRERLVPVLDIVRVVVVVVLLEVVVDTRAALVVVRLVRDRRAQGLIVCLLLPVCLFRPGRRRTARAGVLRRLRVVPRRGGELVRPARRHRRRLGVERLSLLRGEMHRRVVVRKLAARSACRPGGEGSPSRGTDPGQAGGREPERHRARRICDALRVRFSSDESVRARRRDDASRGSARDAGRRGATRARDRGAHGRARVAGQAHRDDARRARGGHHAHGRSASRGALSAAT